MLQGLVAWAVFFVGTPGHAQDLRFPDDLDAALRAMPVVASPATGRALAIVDGETGQPVPGADVFAIRPPADPESRRAFLEARATDPERFVAES